MILDTLLSPPFDHRLPRQAIDPTENTAPLVFVAAYHAPAVEVAMKAHRDPPSPGREELTAGDQ